MGSGEPDMETLPPTTKKTVPTVDKVPPPDKSNNQCPPICTPVFN
jgi:hypothetical protein